MSRQRSPSGRISRARALFLQRGGLVRTAEALRLGIAPATLYGMVRDGLVAREARGLYRLAEIEPLSRPDLVVVARLVPAGVICLVSALAFHELTVQIPHRVYLALPRDKVRPRIQWPPLEIVWLSGRAYTTGIEAHDLEGTKVRVYSREKTVADCFRFRNRIGRDVAVEALKDYLRTPGRDIRRLLECAAADRVQNVMRPYLESLA